MSARFCENAVESASLSEYAAESAGFCEYAAETADICNYAVESAGRMGAAGVKSLAGCDRILGENLSGECEGPECKEIKDNPYIMYVLCSQLREGIGEALIDTGSQVSLVKRSVLQVKENREITEFKTITGEKFEIWGSVELTISNVIFGKSHKFYVVEYLPHNVDVLLGQDWLDEHNSEIRIPWKREITVIPPLSETIVEFPTSERGNRYCPKQNLGNNVLCAESLVECRNGKYCCLIVNLNEDEHVLTTKPNLHTISIKERQINTQLKNRKELLLSKLRLAHIKEGAEQLKEICVEYNDIFRLPGDKLSETKSITHSIPTPSIPKGRAITLKNYRIPEQHQKEVDKQVKEMLDQEIIVPSSSPWNFPIIVVPKKVDASGEKKWRICIDFRKLNDITVGDSYPLPNIQEILDKLGRSRYFSALDCASGYWQIPISKEDQAKTAFSTTIGHFEFTRMPFGLKSAPATFQRLMNNILMGLIGFRCLVYLDDIIIFGETLEEHNERLKEIFQKLREHNMQLEPDKCEFLKTELQYLGHVVTAEGVAPDPKKVESIVRFPTPKTQKDVKSFLGLAGYYRRFISDFSKIAKPLNDLLKKNIEWSWTEKQENSFQELKSKLVKPPVLQFPDFTQPFILTTDASAYAVGGILSQGEIGKDRPIAFASRTLNNAEINYSTVEKELLAIVWSCKHYRPYLLGRKFTVVTDHKPLLWIFNVTDPSSRLLRWRLLLEEYQFNIVHKAGVKNVNADALSRYPVIATSEKQLEEISEDRKRKLLREFHTCPIGGHQGIQRTYERLKLYISWPNMFKDVEEYIKSCETCQINKQTLPNSKTEMQITDTQKQPWDKIYLDLVGPFSTSEKGNKYLLTCQDNLSKYLIAIPIQNQSAETVAKHFVYELILRYGIPNEILTDQGTQFMGQVFQNCCKLLKIRKLNSSAYHPETNGSLERSHKVLVEYLRCFSNKMQSDWDEWVGFACFTFNTCPHTVTKFTPYELLFGRKANLPGQLQSTPQPLYNMEDIVKEIKQKFQISWQQAKEHLDKRKQEQCQKRNEKIKIREYKVGDLVLIVNEQRNKLDPLWTGPYEIIEVKQSNITVRKVGNKGKKVIKTHINRTKPYIAGSHCEDDYD